MTAPEFLTIAAALVALAVWGADIGPACEYGCTYRVSAW